MLRFFIFIFCCFTTAAIAQTSGTITGRITDAETGDPLEYATISLFSQSDSSLVNGTTTDPEGSFTLKVPLGRYYARLQFLSYGDTYENNIRLTAENPQVNLGTLSMTSDSQQLEEVEVVAEKDQVQLALDKRVFNVGESMARIGGSASDILDNIPSVTVDVDGNVALRGSENVRILIDGKPSGLVGISGTDALRALPADMIERVEVITNPSARYQAEGVAGIINIILKKEKRDGINASFNANTGLPHNHGASVNFNYRKNWYNLFLNYGIQYNDFIGRGYSNQVFTRGDSTYYTDLNRSNSRQRFSNSIRLGSDFFLNEHNTLTASFLYRIADNSSDGLVRYEDFDINRTLRRTINRSTLEDEEDLNREVALNYRRTFDKKGQLLTADLQYRRGSELEEANTIESRLSGEGNLRQQTINDEGDRNFLFQADYVNPFGDEGVWEAGWRTTSRKISNFYRVNEMQGGQWQVLDSLSNDFVYYEDVHALYAIIGDKPGRLSYQLGLRAEYSHINTELLQTNETNPRDYLSLFPTTHFTYQVGSTNAIEWSYSRRIRRPGQRWLNPFLSLTDNRNFRTGNPNLNPEFTNSVELGYLHHFPWLSLNSSIYYRHTENVIQRITTNVQTDSLQILLTMPMNLATENSYGLEFVANADITDWWKTNTNFNFYRQIINGDNIEGATTSRLNSDTYTWNARTNMQFKLPASFNAQLTFFYRAPQERPQGRSRSLSVADFGINKEIMERKGTITLRVSDVFNTRRWRSVTFNEDFYSEGEFQWRPRTITLAFTYQLRQTSKRGERPERQQRDGDGDGEDMEF